MNELTPIDLEEFLEQVKSRQYKDLIQHHIKRQNTLNLRQASVGTTSLLPEPLQAKVVDFIDHMNSYAYDLDFWALNCVDVFSLIVDEASEFFPLPKDLKRNSEVLFNIFQIITLSYAYSASSRRKMRKFIGIKKGLLG